MNRRNVLKSEQGFTLIEIIAVLVILGILAAVAVPRYIDLAANARDKAIDAAIAELNSRENLSWANTKLSGGGWTADALPADTDLGTDYTWTSAASVTGGSLKLTSATDPVVLDRSASSGTTPGKWKRH